MGALFEHVSVLQHQDQVGVFDGGQPVGNDEGGAVLHQLVHGVLDLQFGAGIHAAGGLVQNEHGLVGDHGPGDGQLLLLSLGEADMVVQNGIVTLGQGTD